MGQTLTRKLIDAHLVSGKPVAGEEVGISTDQVLLTDTNGTQAWLQFEALGFPRVVPGRVVTYIDHNVYQVDSRNSAPTVTRRCAAPPGCSRSAPAGSTSPSPWAAGRTSSRCRRSRACGSPV